ncbi:MAG: zinc ribbon domain-containing protein [Anaerolineales bacterium]|nr:zinc ribbon domain-containing protein [Anaerolineales bacterium]
MTAGSILLGIALLAAVVLYLAYPFWGAQEQTRRRRQTQRDLLLEQKEALLAQIRSLDFDHETGKLPDEMHVQQRAGLMAEATAVLQQLDALSGKGEVDRAIEAAVARARRQPAPDDAIEAAVARARRRAPAPTNGHAARFCPQCGMAVTQTDKFCAACGHHLIAVQNKA